MKKILNKNKYIILAIGIIAILVIIGGSYAAFFYNFQGNKSNIDVESIELEFLESDTNIINIENAVPMSDKQGIESEETFDFEVKSITKKDKDILYQIYMEKVGTLCSTIENHNQTNNPDCYDGKISESDKNSIINWMATENNGIFGSTTENATKFYNAIYAHDNEELSSLFQNIVGLTEKEASYFISDLESNGYEKYLIEVYENNASNPVDITYEFNGNNYDYSNFLNDDEVKIYLTDYNNNVISGPHKISDLFQKNIYNGTHKHDENNEEIKEKFKIKIWIDEEVNASDWNEETNLEYKFKIGVKTIDFNQEKCFEVTEDGVLTRYNCGYFVESEAAKNNNYEVVPLADTLENINYPVLLNVEIPSEITTETGQKIKIVKIGDGAFSFNNIQSLVLPNGIQTIGEYAFGANDLKKVIIPNGVTTIKNSAFSDNELTSITIPNSITVIENDVFSFNVLTSITIPNSVTTIGDSAFKSNKLTSITIPNSVTSIGDSAFKSNKLTSITIPNSVTTIGDGAFSFNELTNITIPNSITTIGDSAFSTNELTSVTIPNSVTTIGTFAFSDNNLQVVQIGTSTESKITENTGLADGTFYKSNYYNPNLTKIINKSGKPLAFEYSIFRSNKTSYISSGTITNSKYGNVEITLE